MEEQKMQEQEEQKKRRKKEKRNRGARGLSFFHMMQHLSIAAGAALLVMVLINSYTFLDTPEGTMKFNLNEEQKSSSFEDSEMFNVLFGSSVSDLIRFGAIRGQMETNGKFDARKEVDVTAYANRFEGIQPEYITARYYLEDLIKWGRDSAFTFTTTNFYGRELEDFLNDKTIVTRVDTSAYEGGIVSHLNSDLSGVTTTADVSGNFLKPSGEAGGRGEDQEEINESSRTVINVMNNKYHTVEGKNIEDYVSAPEEYEALCINVRNAANDLSTNYNQYLKLKKYYDSSNSNVVYLIRRVIGGEVQIFTNLETDAATISGMKKELERVCSRYVYYDPMRMQFETNTLIEEATLRYILNGFEYAYPEDTQIMIGVNTHYPAADAFRQGNNEFGKYVPYLWQYLAGAAACIVLYLALFLFLTLKEGQRIKKENGEILVRLHWQDRIFTELMLLAAAGIGFLLYYGTADLVNLIWRVVDGNVMVAAASAVALLFGLLFSFFYYSFVRRIKAGTLWKGSLIRRLGMTIKKWIVYAYDHSTVLLRVWAPFGVFVLINVGTAILMPQVFGNSSLPAALVILVLLDGAAGYLLYRSSLAKQEILEGIQLIRGGNLDHKVKEEGMYGEDLILARAVNSIGDSVKDAVETSMKDERLKADLITNVSHDIKTPLTSIINYVDLIKRENVQDQKVREYIEVLDAKSQRLKQLTDDLVEASKISSGNIVLSWEKINLVELLNQTIGEFSEKFEKKALYPVFQAPSGSVFIEADSRRIWRVIENLFNNIFKYALEGTRVYIDITYAEGKADVGQVLLSIKNISAQPLKVNPAELTERFIRGDESRTTEGSGLGLSIAKNLTEAQKGRFEIVMDGDLFKVNMYFPLLKA